MATSNDDDFWTVAMDPGITREYLDETSSDEEESSNVVQTSEPTSNSYFVVYQHDGRDTSTRSVNLQLQSLPLSAGMWSPLGSEAWYGSALLSSLLLNLSDDELIGTGTSSAPRAASASEGLSVLELGSGAVGLSGLVSALRVSKIPGSHRVLLTDNEPRVLQQLQRNVTQTTESLRRDRPSIRLPAVSVSQLDWSDIIRTNETCDNNVHLIIGSELVYTPETAQACSTCVKTLLRSNPRATVWIVQIHDREGWSSIFVPSFLDDEEFILTEETIGADIDDQARRMIPHGGSLDRFDFVQCRIRLRSCGSSSRDR